MFSFAKGKLTRLRAALSHLSALQDAPLDLAGLLRAVLEDQPLQLSLWQGDGEREKHSSQSSCPKTREISTFGALGTGVRLTDRGILRTGLPAHGFPAFCRHSAT